MKKKVIAGLLAMVFVVGMFAGCSGTNKGSSEVKKFVDALNKDLTESLETTKENFEYSESFEKAEEHYDVYISKEVDESTKKERTVSLKIISADNKIKEVILETEHNLSDNYTGSVRYLRTLKDYEPMELKTYGNGTLTLTRKSN